MPKRGEYLAHLGLHAGDVMREQDPDGRINVYGGAVNIASRISGLSPPAKSSISVMGSFCVEDFGTRRLERLTLAPVEEVAHGRRP